MMKKYAPALAVIMAAILWSFDGFIRQNLFTLPSFLIITIEHVIGAILFFPFLFHLLIANSFISLIVSSTIYFITIFYFSKNLSKAYSCFFEVHPIIYLECSRPYFLSSD